MQSPAESPGTHTSGSEFMLRAHCSHFFCSAWLIQHHRMTLSSSELPVKIPSVSIKQEGQKPHSCTVPAIKINSHTPTMVSTFMPEAFQQGYIIQPHHLTDVHVLWQNIQSVCRVSEQKVLLSKQSWLKELEALNFLSFSSKKRLNNNGQCLGTKDNNRDLKWNLWEMNKREKVPGPLIETFGKPYGNCVWWLWQPLDHGPDCSFCNGWEALVYHPYTVSSTHLWSCLRERKKKSGTKVFSAGW